MGRQDFETETLIPVIGGFFDQPTHTLKADGFDASEDGTGRGTPIVPTLRSNGDAHSGYRDADGLIAFAQNSRDEVREIGGNIAGALASQPGMKQQTYLNLGMEVRRLTPTECERLQGFPDNYTLIINRNKPAADGPRYKALGNSMCTNVMEWLGRRIEMVEKIK